MLKSKHIDIICIAVIALTLILTILFMNGASLGITQAETTLGYEDRLFSTDTVHRIDIVMNDWDSFIESCENEEYANCTVLIDGEKYKNVGIRAKGNTSLSSVSSMGSQRYSFKLEFDQYDKNNSYYGLDKLCLNNLIQDTTMMKDYLVYQMMDEFGVDSPLCSYVYITVNGEDWGLYLAVEGVEDSFLQRNYGSDTGDLYKPDSLSFGGGRGNGKDFDINDLDFGDSAETAEVVEVSDTLSSSATQQSQNSVSSFPTNMFSMGGFGNMGGFSMPSVDSMGSMSMPDVSSIFGSSGEDGAAGGIFSMIGGFGMGSDDVKLKYIDDDPESYPNIFDSAKTDVTKSDQTRLINSLKSLSSYTDLEEVLDMDEVLRYFVIHNFVVNGDSYTGTMIHNYYLHEKNGQLSMIPWDYNLAYGTFMGGNGSSTINSSIDSPVSGDMNDRPMVGWIFSSEQYTNAYHEIFSEFIEEWITSGKLTQMIEDTANLIRPYVEKDPTRFCTTEEFEAGVKAISKYATLRGEAVSRQLNGDNTAVSADDLNLSDMGTMNSGGSRGGFGGGDFPSTDFSSAGFSGADFSKGGRGSRSSSGSSSSSTAELSSGATSTASSTASGNSIPSMGSMPSGMSSSSMSSSMPDMSAMKSGMPDMSSMPSDMSFGSMPTGSMPTGTMPSGMPTDMASNSSQPSMDMSSFSGMDFSSFGGFTQQTETSSAEKPAVETITEVTAETTTQQTTERSVRSQSFEMPSNMDFSRFQSGGGNTEKTAWIWVGISTLVLLIGLAIAIKKKY